MAVKNFVLKENQVDSKVTGMKATFLPFLTPPEPTSWPPKDPSKEFLKQHFN